MTWALSEAVWPTTDELIPDPRPCTPATIVCKDGYVIRCVDKYGDEACLSFFACTPSAGTDCRSPVSPEPETVPAPLGGLLLLSALAFIVAARRWRA